MKIDIHGYDRPIIREKASASGSSILEGDLLEISSGKYQEHSTAGGDAEPIFATEGKDNIDHAATAYAVGALVPGVIRPRIVNARLAASQTIVEGDPLESNGDGALRAFAAGNGSGLKVALVAGDSAGDHTVTGIATTDRLVAVLHASTAASIATVADLTAEFSISAADTINNTGGTDTTNDQLWVFYEDASSADAKSSVVGYADEAVTTTSSPGRIKVRCV